MIPGPSATKGGVNDNLVIAEVIVNGARGPAYKPGHGRSPSGGIRVFGINVLGNLVAREEPDGNVIRGPLGSIDTTTNGIEAIAIVLIVGSVLATSS